MVNWDTRCACNVSDVSKAWRRQDRRFRTLPREPLTQLVRHSFWSGTMTMTSESCLDVPILGETLMSIATPKFLPFHLSIPESEKKLSENLVESWLCSIRKAKRFYWFLPQIMFTSSYLIAEALLLLLKLHDSSFQRLSEQKVELQTAWGANQFYHLAFSYHTYDVVHWTLNTKMSWCFLSSSIIPHSDKWAIECFGFRIWKHDIWNCSQASWRLHSSFFCDDPIGEFNMVSTNHIREYMYFSWKRHTWVLGKRSKASKTYLYNMHILYWFQHFCWTQQSNGRIYSRNAKTVSHVSAKSEGKSWMMLGDTTLQISPSTFALWIVQTRSSSATRKHQFSAWKSGEKLLHQFRQHELVGPSVKSTTSTRPTAMPSLWLESRREAWKGQWFVKVWRDQWMLGQEQTS